MRRINRGCAAFFCKHLEPTTPHWELTRFWSSIAEIYFNADDIILIGAMNASSGKDLEFLGDFLTWCDQQKVNLSPKVSNVLLVGFRFMSNGQIPDSRENGVVKIN